MNKAKIIAIVTSSQKGSSIIPGSRTRLSVATVLCAVAWTSVAFAQDIPDPLNDETIADAQQRFAQHVHTIVGSENPGAIPFGEKMRAFFTIQGGGRSTTETEMQESIMDSLTISQSDAAKLAAFAVKEANDKNVTPVEATRQAQDLCAIVTSGDMSPEDVVKFGLELDRLEKLDTARLSAHYRRVVDDLSIEGHRTVLEYVERMVAPAMTFGSIDFEGMLLEAPETFAAHIQNSCEQLSSIPEVSSNNDGPLTNSETNRIIEN